MFANKWFVPIHGFINRLKHTQQLGTSIYIRLLAFLIVLVITMLAGVITVFLSAGVLTVGSRETESFMKQELFYITQNLARQCGDTSVQAVLLSQALSKSIEYQMSNQQLQIADLPTHPELLENIIGNELNRLQLALEKTKCSGAFMVLNATVNPSLENAQYSRAGLYLRNSEPNVVGPDTTRLYLRGFPQLALQNNLSLQSKWDMEFDVRDRLFYQLPIEKYQETSLPLSRLYYWGLEGAIPALGENVILCSIPLIDSAGNPFGVCGFEMSAMNFKLNFSPDNNKYKNLVCMFSRINGNELNTPNALFSGNYTVFTNILNKEYLTYGKSSNELYIYTPPQGTPFVGLHETIRIYPNDSPFNNQDFVLTLMMPKEDLDAILSQLNLRLILLCALLMILGICTSIFISGRYVKPIMPVLDAIRAEEIDNAGKTNILEIDELVELIKSMHSKTPLPDNLFEDFISRVKTLTPTEMSVFKYYLEGKTNNEILSLLFISLSTLKTHNRHIYEKLNISSKYELLLYIELIKKSGKIAEII